MGCLDIVKMIVINKEVESLGDLSGFKFDWLDVWRKNLNVFIVMLSCKW